MDREQTRAMNTKKPEQKPANKSAVEPDKKKLFLTAAFVLVIAVFVCFSAIIVTELVYKFTGEPQSAPSQKGEIKYVSQSFSESAVHEGDLILVKLGYEYVFPSEDKTNRVQVFSFKNSSYAVRNLDQYLERDTVDQLNALMAELERVTGVTDVQLYNGYRSYETQKNDYEKYSDEVAAGFSEHHTGTSFDLNILNGGSIYNNETVLNFMKANAHKYGFIDRYPDDKIDLTEVYHDSSIKVRSVHYRYVGYAHAYYMSANDLCLEEYLKLLSTNYSYEGEHLKFTGDNTKTYEVYYVAKTGAQTEIFVPEGYSYTVSGDNMNGFIVTVCLDK